MKALIGVSLLLLGAVLLGACADEQPPNWPPGASLQAEALRADGLRLRWPAAGDDRGVAGYAVAREPSCFAAVEVADTQLEISGLDDATAYRFSVRAVDEAGNRSPPLVRAISTPDATPPDWGEQKVVRAKPLVMAVKAPLVQLTWKAPKDNVGVAGIELMCGKEAKVVLDAAATSHRLELSTPCPDARLVARDAAGLRSAGLPIELAAVQQAGMRAWMDAKIAEQAGMLALLSSKGSALDASAGSILGDRGSDRNPFADIDGVAVAGAGAGGLDTAAAGGAGIGGLGSIGVVGGSAAGIDRPGEAGAVAAGGAEAEPKPEQPKVRIASVSTAGDGLTTEQVRSFLHESKGELLACYRALLESDPKRAGGRVLLLQVDHGSAQAPEVRGGSLHDTALDTCLKRVLAGLKPADAKGQATVMLLFARE